MQHSVKYIGDNHEQLSIMRKDEKRFNANDFFQYSSENRNKYSIIENGDDLLVSTWYSDSLIKDYQSTIENVNLTLDVQQEQLDIPNIVRKGFVQAMDGNELWINTQSDEMIKVKFKDRETQWKYYCKYVKVTIEVIDESELD